MNPVFNPFTSSFYCGTLRRVRLRMSFLLLFLLLVTFFCSGSLVLGGLICAIWLGSLLLHEFTQIWVARQHEPEDKRLRKIVLWPTGGLELYQGGIGYKARMSAFLAGPLVYLSICLLVTPFVLSDPAFIKAIQFSALPVEATDDFSVTRVLLLVLYINWTLFLINSLPIVPLDMGRLLEEYRRGSSELSVFYHILRGTASVGRFLLIGAGLVFGHTWMVLLGTILLCYALYQKISDLMIAAEHEESESCMGYDFSAGYTSLERPDPVPETPEVTWWERRRQKKQRRLEQKKRLAEIQAREQLDQLLEKVHKSGMASLSAVEQRTLKTASKQIRPQHQG